MTKRPAEDSTAVGPSPTGSRSYAAFISYSHAVDGKLAPALQSGLQQFAKPWYRLRAIRVFRDEASLSANPALWPSIQSALEASAFFILLASPEAAVSPWVQREVEYWRTQRPLDRLLIVLTAGELAWGHGRANGQEQVTVTALPPTLAEAFTEEPLYVDLRWAKELEDVSLRNARFRDRVADLAAPLHGRAKDELLGDDVRQHRRTIRLARAAVAALLTLTAAAIALAAIAILERDQARSQRDRAQSGELAAQAVSKLTTDPEQSVALALSAAELARTPQAEDALRRALGASRFRAKLRGHDGILTSAAFSGDGKHVISTSDDGTARVWDAATGQDLGLRRGGQGAEERAMARLRRASTGKQAALLRTIIGADGIVDFSPNGRLVAVRGRDGVARVWRAGTGELVAVLRGHDNAVTEVAFSRDGSRILTLSKDSTARTWAAATGRPLAVIGSSDDQIETAALSPDGAHVLTIGSHCCRTTGNGADVFVSAAEVWPAGETGDPTLVGGGELTSTVNGADFSSNGKLVVVGVDDTAVVSDAYGDTVAVLRGHTGDVNEMAFSADDSFILTVSADGTARLWQASTGKPVAALRSADGPVTSAAFNYNGRAIVTVSGDDATVWEIAGAETGIVLSRQRQGVRDAAFSPDGRLVATADDDGTARVWRTVSGAQVDVIRPLDAVSGNHAPVKTVVFSRDGRHVLAADAAGVTLWHLGSKDRIRIPDSDVTSAVLAPDGNSVVIGTANGVVDRHEPVNRWAPLPSIRGMPPVLDVAVSRTGKLIAIASNDGTIRLWDLRKYAYGEPQTIRGHAGAVNSVAFSTDGRYLVTASDDRTARVWEWRKPRLPPVVLRGHSGAVNSAAFSPDGRFVVTASTDGTARVWDWRAADDQPVLLRGHNGAVESAAFSPDSRVVLTAGADGTTRLHSCEPCGSFEELIAKARGSDAAG